MVSQCHVTLAPVLTIGLVLISPARSPCTVCPGDTRHLLKMRIYCTHIHCTFQNRGDRRTHMSVNEITEQPKRSVRVADKPR